MLKPFEQMFTTRVKYNRMFQSRSHVINKGLCIPMPFREEQKIPGNCGGFRSVAAVSKVSRNQACHRPREIVLLVGHDESSLPMRDTIHPHSNYWGVSITISSARTAHVHARRNNTGEPWRGIKPRKWLSARNVSLDMLESHEDFFGAKTTLWEVF